MPPMGPSRQITEVHVKRLQKLKDKFGCEIKIDEKLKQKIDQLFSPIYYHGKPGAEWATWIIELSELIDNIDNEKATKKEANELIGRLKTILSQVIF
ncbi:hypothetical protein ACFL1O_00290 [Patescibacteria group bacterium]